MSAKPETKPAPKHSRTSNYQHPSSNVHVQPNIPDSRLPQGYEIVLEMDIDIHFQM